MMKWPGAFETKMLKAKYISKFVNSTKTFLIQVDKFSDTRSVYVVGSYTALTTYCIGLTPSATYV